MRSETYWSHSVKRPLLPNPNSGCYFLTKGHIWRHKQELLGNSALWGLQRNPNNSTKIIKLFITTILWIFYDQFSLFSTGITYIPTLRFYINFMSYKPLACGDASRTVQRTYPAGEFPRDLSSGRCKNRIGTSLRFLPSDSQLLRRKYLIMYQRRRQL
jgi:hypothetical protein